MMVLTRSAFTLLALSFLGHLRLSDAFVFQNSPSHHQRGFTPSVLNYCDDLPAMELPSLQQVTTDSFTDQTYYASTLMNQFFGTEERHCDETELQELVTAQLSHKDGIRGFFAVYLTRDQGSVTDSNDTQMPLLLTKAMKGVDMAHLAPLACMNVIRPTAMAQWHTDPILQQNSAKTAQRAKAFLASLKGSINIVKNYEAVYAVASGRASKDNPLDQFWEVVFDEHEYNAKQRKAIAALFEDLITVSV